MLSGELSRFKRFVSKRLLLDAPAVAEKKDENENDGKGNDGEERGDDERVLIHLGGFKALDQSIAATREVADFCRVARSMKEDAEAAAAAGVMNEEAVCGSEGADGSRDAVHAGGKPGRSALFEPAFLLILHSLEVCFGGSCWYLSMLCMVVS